MSEQLVLLAIGAVVAAFLVWPLLRRRVSSPRPAARTAVEAEPDPASDELSELELDRAMGRVSDEDYARFRTALDSRVVPAMPGEASAVDAVARAEARVARWRDAARATCPNCGLRPEPEARFCSNCGALL